jgi:hypothetical protein
VPVLEEILDHEAEALETPLDKSNATPHEVKQQAPWPHPTTPITRSSSNSSPAEHYSDLLYRVQLKAGNEAYVYLLFEHKSTPAPRVALDLLRYLVRIWDFLGKRGNKTPLPAILPLVIYHGKARWRIAHSFSHLIDAPEALRPYLLEFTYLLTDLSHLRDEEIQGEVILRMGLWILKYIFRGNYLSNCLNLWRCYRVWFVDPAD